MNMKSKSFFINCMCTDWLQAVVSLMMKDLEKMLCNLLFFFLNDVINDEFVSVF